MAETFIPNGKRLLISLEKVAEKTTAAGLIVPGTVGGPKFGTVVSSGDSWVWAPSGARVAFKDSKENIEITVNGAKLLLVPDDNVLGHFEDYDDCSTTTTPGFGTGCGAKKCNCNCA